MAASSTKANKSSQDDVQVDPWCINVKAVGVGFEDFHSSSTDDETTRKAIGSEPRSFNVMVRPDDRIGILHEEIEGVTGVKSSEQRLIYRGRLIGMNDVFSTSTNNSFHQHDFKIKDITGLCDGQTIHLVKKRDTKNIERGELDASSEISPTDNNTATSGNLNGSRSGNGGSTLLAALLGIDSGGSGGSNSDRPESLTAGTGATTPLSVTSTESPTISPWRSSRAVAGNSGYLHRNRRYRLLAEDLEVPDPGSLEPVRQGLMTLHTIMNCGQNESEEGRSHPLNANREFFRGQWIDARDTVNQWLEATVVEILDPQDVLNNTAPQNQPESTSAATSAAAPLRQRRPVSYVSDPAISANDLEGRRTLLLEACESGDPRAITIGNIAGVDEILPQSSFRPRSNNNGVKLLLIHYNGWPHRWDEWIRSDSERLRIFRTRTRNLSSIASPTPQSIFDDAPRTHIRNGDEEEDRFGLLPELNIVVSQVSQLLGELVVKKEYDSEDDLEDLRSINNTTSTRAKNDLPWMSRDKDSGVTSKTDRCKDDRDSPIGVNVVEADQDDEQESADDDVFSEQVQVSSTSDARDTYNKTKLRNLSTLFDRLGRILTASAPHVASMAASLPEEINNTSSDELASITDAIIPREFDSPSIAPLGGLLSLWSRERRRQNGIQERHSTATATIEPDHVDFASGVVNTTHGEVRSSPRTRTSQDDVANLLGTYLAATSLGSANTGSDGTQGDNGIDIHIHAIVTAPGASPSGIGIAFGGRSPTTNLGTARNLLLSNRSNTLSIGREDPHESRPSSANPNLMDEVDADLFSELYTENPSPIDPNGTQGLGGEADEISNSHATARDENTNDYSSIILNNETSSSNEQSLRVSNGRSRSRSGVFRSLFRRRSPRNNGGHNEET